MHPGDQQKISCDKVLLISTFVSNRRNRGEFLDSFSRVGVLHCVGYRRHGRRQGKVLCSPAQQRALAQELHALNQPPGGSPPSPFYRVAKLAQCRRPVPVIFTFILTAGTNGCPAGPGPKAPEFCSPPGEPIFNPVFLWELCADWSGRSMQKSPGVLIPLTLKERFARVRVRAYCCGNRSLCGKPRRAASGPWSDQTIHAVFANTDESLAGHGIQNGLDA